MKTIFNTIQVTYSEYGYFRKLSKSERVNFLFELYDAATYRHNNPGFDLSKFIDTLKTTFEEYIEPKQEPAAKQQADMPDDVDLVDVMIDDDNIMAESNSLRALRHIVYKLFEAGYILQRDKDMEKMFRKDKVTRYLRIFRIVDQISTLGLS